jgi:hypothetical protein
VRDDRWDAFSPRQQRLIKFALWLFASDARARANHAAQDLRSQAAGKAVGAFLRDAEEAEHLLGLLRDAGTTAREPA